MGVNQGNVVTPKVTDVIGLSRRALWSNPVCDASPTHPHRPMTATIALVDDDRNILTSVSIALQTEGFLTRV